MPSRLAISRRPGTLTGSPARRAALAVIWPVAGIAAFITGGPLAALVALTAVPAVVVLAGVATARRVDPVTGLMLRDGLEAVLDDALRQTRRAPRQAAAFVIEIDRFRMIEERHDRADVERILRLLADRLRGALREGDAVARLDGPVLAAAITPARRLDLESALQLAGRIQRAVSEPLPAGGGNVFVTASVGFALAARLDAGATGATLLRAASLAAIEAGRSGPGAIRSYSPALRRRVDSRASLSVEVADALEKGEIMAFFQPQVSTRTGAVTGFETLARWHHPERGLIPPGEFLPALRQAGMMDRLGARMVTEALGALCRWDAAGFSVPRVGVNFSTEELMDPRLPERLAWELDRFELAPDRLGIEVLETVVAGRSEETVLRNLTALARLGCALDLDDFGTGHASITNIRRFAIGRIKIDRTFVTRIDADPEQQNMVAAILTMAERLGLDTLAEGVETDGEQAMLARLGCAHVQGFGIGRPMPVEETLAWLAAARDRAAGPVPLRRQAG